MTYSPMSLNASAYAYHLSVQEEVNDLCTPLLAVGISYFHYMRFFKTGHYLHLTNNAPFLKDLYETIIEAGDFLTEQFTKVSIAKNYYESFA